MTTQNPANRPRALIAMSGGVDSSVAACLMQQAGYDCTGITMRLTHNETLGQSGYQTCCSEKDIEDAAEVAFALDMPYQVLDFTADFRAQIIEKFIRVYEAGGTPNPCIDCNKYMKFRHLLDWAAEHGMDILLPLRGTAAPLPCCRMAVWCWTAAVKICAACTTSLPCSRIRLVLRQNRSLPCKRLLPPGRAAALSFPSMASAITWFMVLPPSRTGRSLALLPKAL